MSTNHTGQAVNPAIFDDTDEREILGCLLTYPERGHALLGPQLRPDLFFSPPCRTIFEAMQALLMSGVPLEVSTVTSRLRDIGELEKIGGAYEITQLVTRHGCGLAASSYHLGKMRRQAAARVTLQASQRLADMANNTSLDPAELVAEMERATDALRAFEDNGGGAGGKPMLEFLTPSQLRDFDAPAGWNIVGDYHIQRTSPFVIGGPPGTGKSRALTFLALSGATGQPFFGMQVHQPFRTMILQCENGRVRLKNELAALGPEVDEFIRYSPPPPYGFAFTDSRFLRELRAAVEDFRPDVFALDPWNRLARDDKGKDYKEAFEAILSVLPTGDDCPAIGIVAHTRKPQVGERADGRALLNLLAGSYVLGSVPRSVFILQPASDDSNDDRCIWSCAKNNDGTLGDRSAWIRRNGLFAPCPDFDWSELDKPEDSRKTVTEEHMAQVFDGGKAILSRAEAKKRLEELTGFTKTPCYNAVNPDGRFRGRLTERKGLLYWK